MKATKAGQKGGRGVWTVADWWWVSGKGPVGMVLASHARVPLYHRAGSMRGMHSRHA